MFGAIAGDIIASVYESRPVKLTEFDPEKACWLDCSRISELYRFCTN